MATDHEDHEEGQRKEEHDRAIADALLSGLCVVSSRAELLVSQEGIYQQEHVEGTEEGTAKEGVHEHQEGVHLYCANQTCYAES